MWALSPRLAAASASMRPSWPPPRMPTVDPGVMRRGGLTSRVVLRALRDSVGLPGPPGVQTAGERVVAERQDGRRKQRGVDRAGAANGERADRDARRHLNDGE